MSPSFTESVVEQAALAWLEELGYESRQLHEGCGMAGICRDVASCSHCREIVDIRETSGRRRCPKCRRAVTLIEVSRRPGDSLSDNDEEFEPVPQAQLTCPRCGKASLSLVPTGLWN
jgi:ribosomal protein L37AE/L43A